MADKARVTLGRSNTPIAGMGAITWRLTTGTQPYQTAVQVNARQWPELEDQRGEPLTLTIEDSRGARLRIEEVYILHVLPSDSPHRVTFVISDKRWKWPYKLICRDYNVPRKTGDRTAFGNVPTQTVVDQYRYRRSSLNPQGERWSAQDAIEDVLEQIEPGAYSVESFPVNADNSAGEISLQNLQLRDSADAALGRALAQVPGADVFVAADGTVTVFDASDLTASEEYRASLPNATWAGDKSEQVDRDAIRPSKVSLFYQREVEVLLEHHDDYNSTAPPIRTEPYLENVIPTVDETTEITQYDPETDRIYTYSVPSGTYVTVREWLFAMNERRPSDAFEWTFDKIRKLWLMGDLDGALGTKADDDERASIYARLAAFRQHFRQTYRVNRRYMERVRDIQAVRVALLDPITGARAPAGIWGQACILPTEKGKRRIARKRLLGEDTGTYLFENVDYIPTSGDVVEAPTAPARVSIVDKELGVFRVDWIESPYGLDAAIIPCHMVDDQGVKSSPVGDLARQDEAPIGPGIKVGGREAGLFLAYRQHMYVLLTIVPAAPNNERQFHRVDVEPSAIAEQYQGELRIQEGKGPEMQVFIPPGEASARFGWITDDTARQTLVQLLGLNDDNPQSAGIEGPTLPGFLLVNGEDVGRNELTSHSRAAAAEQLVPFADSVMGRVATILEGNRAPTLKGNMSGATISVAGAPSGAVHVLHEFPGSARPIGRLALLPASVRRLILGVVDPGIGD